LALGAVIAVAFTACSGDGDQESSSVDASEQTAAPVDTAGGSLTGADSDAAPENTAAAAEAGVGDLGSADIAASDLTTLGRDIAIEIHVTMTSDDLRRTVQGITQSASAHGGAVFASDIDYGVAEDSGANDSGTDETPRTGRATLTVKVPPAELDAVLSGLDQLGSVLSTNQQAQDVTDQLVDLAVRIRNAEQSVDRVREFLESTTDLRQMVDLEGELTRRQTDLEQLLATQANLGDRVSLSTLTIDVYPATAAPDPVDESSDGIGDAFRSGWDVFVGVVFAAGFVLAVLAPFLVLAAIVLAIAWFVARPRWRRPPADPSPARTVDVSDAEDLAGANRPR
jgi:hypothetical protein